MNSLKGACFLNCSADMWLLLFQDRGTAFLASLAVGCIIGLIYDVFRLVRVVYSGGRIKLFFEDVLFCVMSALVFTVFMFNVNMGVIRMFTAVGVLMGFFAYRFSVGMFTVPAARWLKGLLTPPVKRAIKRCSHVVSVFMARRITFAEVKSVKRFPSKVFR